MMGGDTFEGGLDGKRDVDPYPLKGRGRLAHAATKWRESQDLHSPLDLHDQPPTRGQETPDADSVRAGRDTRIPSVCRTQHISPANARVQ
jgi:hypothetical protein